jgi:ATP-binding cassette subfamily B protein
MHKASSTPALDLSVFKLLRTYLWPKGSVAVKSTVFFSIVLILASKICAIWTPLFYRQAVNALSLNPRDFSHLVLASLAAYGLTRVLAVGLLELKDFLFARVEQRAVRLVATRVFEHLNALSLRFHLDRQTGSVTRSLEKGSRAIETFLKFSTFTILPLFMELALVLGTVLYLYGWILMGMIASVVIIYTVYTLKVTQWRAAFVKQKNKQDTECNHRAVESLLNYETVKYFGNERLELKRFDTAQKAYEEAAVKDKRGLAILNTGQGLIVSLGLVGTLCFMGNKIMEGHMTLGDLVLVNVYFAQLYQPLNMLGWAYREIKRSLLEMGEMINLLGAPVEISDETGAKLLKGRDTTIVFDKVSFAYYEDRPILKNISFEVPAHHKVAIVGPSGSGKSTIAKLLFRFYDVTAGQISIGGQDIRRVTQGSLRKLIGVVPQDMVLFNESIAYNVGYGDPKAPKGDIEWAVKSANLKSFVSQLPLGLETIVGERGLKVSGGEKQRIAIARTLLKRPKIFLFDEATSSLDSKTEKNIQENLNKISNKQTTILIAHRLSTVVDADQILVLDRGEIVERGSHETLLKKKGIYAEMWTRQHKKKL